jgi:hypothetical protein
MDIGIRGDELGIILQSLMKLFGCGIVISGMMWIAGKTKQIPKIVSGKKVLDEHSVFQIVT